MLGNDPVHRRSRGSRSGIGFLEGGIPFLPVLIGVFAFAPDHVARWSGWAARAAAAERVDRAIRLAVSHGKVIWEILSRPFLLLWSSFIGLLIGVLPAIGGSAANMMAYDQAKKFSRHPEKFGTGMPEGHHRLGGVEQRQRRPGRW